MKYKYQILLIISIIALVASVMLSFSQTEHLFCATGGGCDIVHASPYNYTFGIQNSYYGIAIFLVLSILIFSQLIRPSITKKKTINIAIVIGSIIVAYFLCIQAFVLRAWCRYCLIVDTSMMIAFIITLIGWRD